MCCCFEMNMNATGITENSPKSSSNKEGFEKRWVRNPAFDYQPQGIVRDAREQVWDILRQGKGITTTAICEQVPTASRKQVEYWLKGWAKGGYVKVVGDKRPYQHLLVRDVGQEPPRLDRQGKLLAIPLNEVVWRGMRIQKTFNARQLVASAGENLQIDTVRTYLRQLAMAGYLKEVATVRGMLTTYKLVEDTGSKPPQILKNKSVYDPNLGIIVYHANNSSANNSTSKDI